MKNATRYLYNCIEKYKFSQYLFQICKRKLLGSQKTKIIDIIRNSTDTFLDSTSLFKMFLEIQFLKYLLFSQDQLKIYEFLIKSDNLANNNKEMIYINRNFDSFSKSFVDNFCFLKGYHNKNEIEIQSRNENESKEIMNALKNMYNERESTLIDIKLLKNLEIMFK